ncbi:hypothetical protein T484DRAFT_1799929 [Baffinella frigidus]|nr:hypothetical protein T484DRAFT_1799929 [Cryptophyta sp. CCMP2293]
MSTIVRDATTTLQERLKPRVPFRVVITIDFLGQTLPGKLATRAGTLTLRIVDTSIGYVRSTFPVKWLEGVILPKAAAATRWLVHSYVEVFMALCAILAYFRTKTSSAVKRLRGARATALPALAVPSASEETSAELVVWCEESAEEHIAPFSPSIATAATTASSAPTPALSSSEEEEPSVVAHNTSPAASNDGVVPAPEQIVEEQILPSAFGSAEELIVWPEAPSAEVEHTAPISLATALSSSSSEEPSSVAVHITTPAASNDGVVPAPEQIVEEQILPSAFGSAEELIVWPEAPSAEVEHTAPISLATALSSSSSEEPSSVAVHITTPAASNDGVPEEIVEEQTALPSSAEEHTAPVSLAAAPAATLPSPSETAEELVVPFPPTIATAFASPAAVLSSTAETSETEEAQTTRIGEAQIASSPPIPNVALSSSSSSSVAGALITSPAAALPAPAPKTPFFKLLDKQLAAKRKLEAATQQALNPTP